MSYPFFKELFERSDASGSRSTILKPLTWFLSILIGGVLSLTWLKASEWLVIFFCIVIVAVILLFLFAYIFCLFRNPDALRSESFSIQKLAIEKGVYGDSTTGMIKIESKKLGELAGPSDKEQVK